MGTTSPDELRFNRFGLSQQEARVLSLAMSGHIDKDIATEIGISLGTVRVYWKRIRMKVGGTRSEAIATLARSSLKLNYDDEHVRAGDLERELHASMVREGKLRVYEAAFFNFPLPMAILDAPTGAIVRVNAAFAALHGYKPDEMEGIESVDLVAESVRSQYAKQARAAAKEGKRMEMPTIRRHKDGSTFEAQSQLVIGSETTVLAIVTG